MTWLTLALITPLLWSIVVLIDDNLVRGIYRSPETGAAVSGIFGGLPLISLLWRDTNAAASKFVLFAVLSGAMTILYYFYYFRALTLESPSVVVAMFSLTPVSVPILAWLLVGERLGTGQIVGFAVVLFFTVLLALRDVRGLKFSKAMVPILLAIVSMDVVLLSQKYAYANLDFYTGFMWFCGGMVLASLCFVGLIYRKNHARSKKTSWLKVNAPLTMLLFLVATELINQLAEFTSNLAVSRGPVSLVEVLQNTQPMYMLLLSLVLFPFFPKFFREAGEGYIAFKLLAMTGIIAGIVITLVFG